MLDISTRVFVPAHLDFGTVTGRVVYDFGVLTAYRVRLDDGRDVIAAPDELASPDNVEVLPVINFRHLFSMGAS